MVTVYAAHGTVAGFDANAFIHRNMIDHEAAARFLIGLPTKYVDLDLAKDGHGDALTIDDGTVAAAQLARLARQAGHAVTLFVNPENIANSQIYPFVLLNVFLDRIQGPSLNYNGLVCHLGTPAAKLALRKLVKKRLASMCDDRQRENHIRELAKSAGVQTLPVPDHLQTLAKRDIEALLADGVRIENHGWSHRDLSDCDAASFREEIEKGQRWLATELGVRATAFAIPYGEALPPRYLQRELANDWYLLDNRLNPGTLGHRLFNRLTLSNRRISES